LSECVSNHSSVGRINLAVLATTVETSSGDQWETKVFIITPPLRCVSVQLIIMFESVHVSLRQVSEYLNTFPACCEV